MSLQVRTCPSSASIFAVENFQLAETCFSRLQAKVPPWKVSRIRFSCFQNNMKLRNILLFSNFHEVFNVQFCAFSLENKMKLSPSQRRFMKTRKLGRLDSAKPNLYLYQVFIPNSGHNWERVLLEPNFNSELHKNAAKHTQKYGKLKDAHHARGEGEFPNMGTFSTLCSCFGFSLSSPRPLQLGPLLLHLRT